MEIVLSERTNRIDKDKVLKYLRKEIEEKYSKTDLKINNIDFNKYGWLIIDVSEEKFFISTINKFTIFPLAASSKFLITGKIDRIEKDYVKIFFPDKNGENSILNIKIEKIIKKIGIPPILNLNNFLEFFHIKQSSPMHIYLGREENISYYHVNTIIDWYKRGMNAISINDVTITELKNFIYEKNLDKVIVKIYPLTLLSYRLVLRIGTIPEVIENEIKKSFKEIGIDIVTSSFNWIKVSKIFHQKSYIF